MFFIYWYLVNQTCSFVNCIYSDFTTKDTIFNWYDPLESNKLNKNSSSKFFRNGGSYYDMQQDYRNFCKPSVDSNNVSKLTEHLYEKYNFEITPIPPTPAERFRKLHNGSSELCPCTCLNIHLKNLKNLNLALKEFNDPLSHKLLYEAYMNDFRVCYNQYDSNAIPSAYVRHYKLEELRNVLKWDKN